MENGAGLPSQRELIRQLIDVRRREERLIRENEQLQRKIQELKDEIGLRRRNGDNVLIDQLKHAQRELAQKRQRPMLSNEEWQLIREFRGEC